MQSRWKSPRHLHAQGHTEANRVASELPAWALGYSAPGQSFGLTEIWLRQGHGPLGRWCGSGSGVEVHVIQGLIHRLPRVLPCGDFFYVTKRRKTIIFLIVSIIIIIIITHNSTTIKQCWLLVPEDLLTRGEYTVFVFIQAQACPLIPPHPRWATLGICRTL